jgi:hypothetical protein
MTREDAIKGLKVLCKDFSGYKPNEEMFDMAIKALEQQPSDDCVSLGVYKQVARERDVAIEQLKELGYELGEKIRSSVDCVSRQAVDMLCIRYLKTATDEHVAFYEEFCSLPLVTPAHGTCRDCEYYRRIELNSCDEVVATCKKHTDRNYQYVSPNFYCADYEKRGNEND